MMELLGGPKIAGVIHRIAGTTFGTIFFGHIAVALNTILVKEKGRFEWFGSQSLLPNKKDCMFIIGLSGLTLWFPVFFGKFLPGWVFNVATIIHGEEAFLPAVFLFTVTCAGGHGSDLHRADFA